MAQRSGYLTVKAPSPAMRKRDRQPKINVYNVSSEKLVLASELKQNDVTSISRNYGIEDLYVDASQEDRNHIEKKLSSLESDTAQVIRLIVDAGKAVKTQPVVLERRQLNTLRKFLFTMSFRHTDRAAQFNNNAFDPLTQRSLNQHIAENMDNPRARGNFVCLSVCLISLFVYQSVCLSGMPTG